MWGLTVLLQWSLLATQPLFFWLAVHGTIRRDDEGGGETVGLPCVFRVDETTFFSFACVRISPFLCVQEVLCLFCLTSLLFRLLRLLFVSIWFLVREMQLNYAISIFFTYFHFPSFSPKVSFAAHIAGGFAGMSIGYTVFSCFDKALLKDPRFWIAIAAYLACVLFAVFFNIFLSPANWPASNISQLIKRAI